MDRPTMEKKTRNFCAATGCTLAAMSYGAVHAMQFWKVPADYWFAWATILTGLGLQRYSLSPLSSISHISIHCVEIEVICISIHYN